MGHTAVLPLPSNPTPCPVATTLPQIVRPLYEPGSLEQRAADDQYFLSWLHGKATAPPATASPGTQPWRSSPSPSPPAGPPAVRHSDLSYPPLDVDRPTPGGPWVSSAAAPPRSPLLPSAVGITSGTRGSSPGAGAWQGLGAGAGQGGHRDGPDSSSYTAAGPLYGSLYGGADDPWVSPRRSVAAAAAAVGSAERRGGGGGGGPSYGGGMAGGTVGTEDGSGVPAAAVPAAAAAGVGSAGGGGSGASPVRSWQVAPPTTLPAPRSWLTGQAPKPGGVCTGWFQVCGECCECCVTLLEGCQA